MAASGATPIPSPQRQTPVPTSQPMAADSTQMSSKPSQSVNTNAAENTPLFTPTPDVSHNSSTDAPAQVKFCPLRSLHNESKIPIRNFYFVELGLVANLYELIPMFLYHLVTSSWVSSGPSFTFYKKSDSTRPHQNMDTFVVYLPLFYIMGFKISQATKYTIWHNYNFIYCTSFYRIQHVEKWKC